MEPFEVMTSESQERMLAIVTPEGLPEVLRLCERWEVQATVVGKVTEPVDGVGLLRIVDGFDGEVLAEVPASSLHDAAPLYDRPRAEPADRAERAARQPEAPADLAAALLDQLCDSTWVSSQYDHQLFLNTVEGPGGDAVVLRLKHPVTGEDTGRGMAITTDGNHRWCAVDPRQGTALTVAESVLNLACVGARPIALVNCLNFGNPEHPEVMWQLSEAVDGMTEACLAFGLPVIGGNVSLYNETGGVDIDPTPVVGLLGLVDRLDRRPPGVGLAAGDRLVLLGDDLDGPEPSLAGSTVAWASGQKGGTLPPLDAAAHCAVAELVRGLVADGVPSGIHDISTGGLGVALAELACRSGVGVEVSGVPSAAHLFTEAPSRVVVAVPEAAHADLLERAAAAGVPAADLGIAGGERVAIEGLVDLALDDVVRTWRDRLPEALGTGNVQG
jgi:phosphoribosylformylglycinamidine synthase